MPIPLNSRKSPVQLRKRLIAAIARASNRPIDNTDTRNIVPLPEWMQSRSFPAQSPPEIAPVLAATDAVLGFPVVNEDLSNEDLVNVMRGEANLDASNLGAWQEVVPRRLARSNRFSSQASPAVPGRKSPRILHLSDVNSPVSFSAMTSSTSGGG